MSQNRTKIFERKPRTKPMMRLTDTEKRLIMEEFLTHGKIKDIIYEEFNKEI